MSCFGKKNSNVLPPKTQSKESNRNNPTTNPQTTKIPKQDLSSTVLNYVIPNSYGSTIKPSILKHENANKSAELDNKFDNKKIIRQQSTKPESDQRLIKKNEQKPIAEQNNDDSGEDEKTLKRKKPTKSAMDVNIYKNYEEVVEKKK